MTEKQISQLLNPRLIFPLFPLRATYVAATKGFTVPQRWIKAGMSQRPRIMMGSHSWIQTNLITFYASGGG